MKHFLKNLALTVTVAASVTGAANAHRFWIVPSSTVVSGTDQWIAFDASISNDLFYPNYYAIDLDTIKATAPDGSTVELVNAHEGRTRSTFEMNIKDEGTYRIASVVESARASYKENGEEKSFMGTIEGLIASGIPSKNPEEMFVLSRISEAYITLGAPNNTVLKPTGKGLEFVPVTHPNDLFSGEEATFKLTKDGKPIAGKTIEVVAGNTRYRNDAGTIAVTTTDDGSFKVTWPQAGRYFFEVDTEDEITVKGVTLPVYSGLSVVLEVLPQ